jgi:hypothetical protein
LRNARDNHDRSSPPTPTREQIERIGYRVVKDGGPYKADLLEVDLGDGPMAIKDYARKGWLVRRIGRFQIRRECGAYRWLTSQDGIPALIGRIDRYALALEKIDGRPLDDSTCPPEDGGAIFERLAAVVRGLHRRGLVHWDLRTRKNVVVGPDRRVYVLDFASAFWLRPRGTAHGLLFSWLKLVDRAALLKWKLILGAGPYTPDEEAFLRRFRFWRSLWIFHLPSKRES